jgi:hypothetical protein|tara:strand:+ start:363 stop:587 length:225 start_codon:yes stop_codon:yes gene_type:complete
VPTQAGATVARLENIEVVRFAIAGEADEVLIVLGFKLLIIQLDELNDLVYKSKDFLGLRQCDPAASARPVRDDP